jgi:hypothetical protein
MTNIKTLTIRFANQLERHEIPLFRGAIIATIGRENDVLLHNHVGVGFRYAYPEIQYKIIDGKAAIVAINNGIKSIAELLSVDEMDIRIGDKNVVLEIESTDIKRIEMDFIPELKRYTLNLWLPLNQENYKAYTECNDMIERIEMLQRTLTGNIISMAKGLDIHLDERIELKIIDIKEQKPVIFKRQKMMTFNAVFAVNMNLPIYIGLGKGTSLGFGTINEQS